MSDYELKPCPFCGGEAKVITITVLGDLTEIVCGKCGVRTPLKDKSLLTELSIIWEVRTQPVTCGECKLHDTGHCPTATLHTIGGKLEYITRLSSVSFCSYGESK